MSCISTNDFVINVGSEASNQTSSIFKHLFIYAVLLPGRLNLAGFSSKTTRAMSASSSSTPASAAAVKLQSTLGTSPTGTSAGAAVVGDHNNQEPPAEEVIWKFPDNPQSFAYTKDGKVILKRAACSGAANLKYKVNPEEVQLGVGIAATPVICNFAQSADVPMMAELLRLGGNLESMGERGDTPLMTACLNVFSSAKMKVGDIATDNKRGI